MNVSLPAWQCASSILQLLCVSNQMFFQTVWSAERLNTQGATEGFLSSMHSHVLLQPVYSVECLGALNTLMGLFLGWINFLVPRIKQRLHVKSGVADTYHFDADPYLAFHFDPDPDQDPRVPFTLKRILPLNLMPIRIRILPLTFSRFEPSNAPK